MIEFIEHKETGYAMRTWDNARLSDLTIAFAIDFTTPGEILTRKAAYGKYCAIELQGLFNNIDYATESIVKKMYIQKINKLNIAGNGIYSLCTARIFQEDEIQYEIDQLILDFLFLVKTKFRYEFSIRSGGQTGIDEAALKAGDKLGLETICLAPKNWLFRDINGRDICSQSLFLKRFGPQYDITDIL